MCFHIFYYGVLCKVFQRFFVIFRGCWGFSLHNYLLYITFATLASNKSRFVCFTFSCIFFSSDAFVFSKASSRSDRTSLLDSVCLAVSYASITLRSASTLCTETAFFSAANSAYSCCRELYALLSQSETGGFAAVLVVAAPQLTP